MYVGIGKEGGQIDTFYCGKPSKPYRQQYLGKEGSDEVWLVSGSPKSSFSRQPNDWRDKKVLDLDRTMLQRILLKYPTETLELTRQIASPKMDSTLTKADTTWLVHPPKGEPFKPVDKEFNRIMNTICRINTVEFLDRGRDTIPTFGAPEFGVEVFLEGGQHEMLDFWPNTKGDATRYMCRKNGDDRTIFLVYQSSVKNLMKTEDILRNGEKEEPPPPNPKGGKMPPRMPPKMPKGMPPGMKMPTSKGP